MIQITDIKPQNLYSQNDAEFLLGDGFSKKAAKEHISQACRLGELKASKNLGRWWFTGDEFLKWVRVHIQGKIEALDSPAAECKNVIDGAARLASGRR